MLILLLLIFGIVLIALGLISGLLALIGIAFAIIWKLCMFVLPILGVVLIVIAFFKKNSD